MLFLIELAFGAVGLFLFTSAFYGICWMQLKLRTLMKTAIT